MKSFFKKSLAVFLSLTVIFSLIAVAFPSASALDVYTEIPTVYVEGQGYGLGIKQEDGSYDQVYGIQIPEGYIEAAVEENIDVFIKAVITQDWDDFCDVLYEKFTPLYAEIKLDENNPLCNMKIMDIFKAFNTRILICAVQRKNEVIIPHGDFVLQAGDRIHITAPRGVLVSFMKQLKIYKHRTKDIMITGGGKMGYYLARQLCATGGYNVKIIEMDAGRCEELCELLPEANIIHGDGTDRAVLLEQGIEGQDAFVALTTIDEENIISAMYASSLGIGKTVAKVNRVSYEVLESIGMDSAFSSKAIAANRIIAYVRALENSGEESSVQTLYKLVGGQVEALEFKISSDFHGIDIPLKDLDIRHDSLIACIIRNHQVIFPSGNDCIEKDDNVVVVTKANHISSINEIFE